MNFLTLYKEFCTEITDAPENYHDYMAMATVGIVMGNDVYLPFGDTRIYPNVWLILLGDSSYSRKTTSINIGKKLLSEVFPERIYPNEFSQEKIQSLLGDHPAGGFFFSEFVTLMGLLSRDYMSGTKGFLADIYDSPFTYRRETQKGTVEIRNPAISIISATTQSWFTDRMKESDIMGGFLPRFLMIMPGQKTKSLAIPPEADFEKKKVLRNILEKISQIKGVAYLKPDAKAYFEGWYEKLCSWPSNGRTQPFIQRLQIYTLKFAMILSAINSGDLKINHENMAQAVEMVRRAAKDLTKIDDEELVFGKVQINMKKVIDYLRKHGQTPKSKLLMNTRLSSREFLEAITTLMDSERVKEVKIKTTTKPVTLYEIKEEL